MIQYSNLLKQTIIWLVITLLLVVLFFLYFDRNIDVWSFQMFHNSELYRICHGPIYFVFNPKNWFLIGIVCTIIGIILSVLKKIPTNKSWLFIGLSLVVTYIITIIIKVTLARYRPEMYFAYGNYGFHYFSTANKFNSMPSGHVSLNFAGFIAIGLLVRHRVVLVLGLLIATLVALSRIVALAHFPSDLILGLYVGIFTTLWIRVWLQPNNKIKS